MHGMLHKILCGEQARAHHSSRFLLGRIKDTRERPARTSRCPHPYMHLPSAAAAMKVILLTGSTDGIGLEAAKQLVAQGHQVLIHGRNPTKLQQVQAELSLLVGANSKNTVESYQADLSDLAQVEALVEAISKKHSRLDVLINNAGVFKSSNSTNADGIDLRFVVNTIAPYLLTKRLLPLIPKHGRVINVSSAAQAPVDFNALVGRPREWLSLSQNEAYAQSKLAITMWTNALAPLHPELVMTSVNPASLIGTKMVREAFGIDNGKDLGIGADILREAALSSKRFGRTGASGKYFDNDVGDFRPPHRDALDKTKVRQLQEALDTLLSGMGYN